MTKRTRVSVEHIDGRVSIIQLSDWRLVVTGALCVAWVAFGLLSIEHQAETEKRQYQSQTQASGRSAEQPQGEQAAEKTDRSKNDAPDWYTRIVTTNLGLIIVGSITFVLIGWQAWIYRRQANLMLLALQASLDQQKARLYVEGVRVASFNPDEQPVFFLEIVNAGPVPAENVVVFVEVHFVGGHNRPSADGNAILVPANGRREYDFPASFVLPPNLADVDQWNLRVSGTVTYDSKSIPFCFKYSPWLGPRPAGLRTFVPCDYDWRRTISIQIGGVLAVSSAGSLKVKKMKSDDEKKGERPQ